MDSRKLNNKVDAGTIMSRFRKNRDNVISAIQESPINWIYLSNKSAERENSHQVYGQSLIF